MSQSHATKFSLRLVATTHKERRLTAESMEGYLCTVPSVGNILLFYGKAINPDPGKDFTTFRTSVIQEIRRSGNAFLVETRNSTYELRPLETLDNGLEDWVSPVYDREEAAKLSALWAKDINAFPRNLRLSLFEKLCKMYDGQQVASDPLFQETLAIRAEVVAMVVEDRFIDDLSKIVKSPSLETVH